MCRNITRTGRLVAALLFCGLSLAMLSGCSSQTPKETSNQLPPREKPPEPPTSSTRTP
jgi:hypothetical protein